MESDAYAKMSETEDYHWWYKARRLIIKAFIQKINFKNNIDILEIGCGSGGNFKMLSGFGEVYGMDLSKEALAVARDKAVNSDNVKDGCFPSTDPFICKKFDLICLFDVLEHLDNDYDALVSLKKYCKSGTKIMITVPAYKWLWSAHDDYIHHKKRYTMHGISRLIKHSGFNVIYSTYYNTLLFPLLVIVRIISTTIKNKRPLGIDVPLPVVNNILYYIFSSECGMLMRVRFLFGASILLIIEDVPAC
jgi:SAM-dependent methyltransferase